MVKQKYAEIRKNVLHVFLNRLLYLIMNSKSNETLYTAVIEKGNVFHLHRVSQGMNCILRNERVHISIDFLIVR